MSSQLRPAIVSLLVLTAITGVAYPLAVTGVAHAMFPDQARGSVVKVGDKAVGSRLIAQPFAEPQYFWPRPSACNYNGGAAGGSNLGPSNDALKQAVAARIAALRAADPGNMANPPVDLVTASGSGIDPHISPAAAGYQVARVARVRNLPVEQVRSLVDRHTEGRTFGVLGEPRVNVLLLNLALDGTSAAD